MSAEPIPGRPGFIDLCASRICAIPAIFLTGITAHHHSQGFVLCTSHSSHGQLSHLPVPHHDLLKKPGWQITSPFCPFKALGIQPSDLSPLQICFRAGARTTGQDNLGKSGDGNGRFIVVVDNKGWDGMGFIVVNGRFIVGHSKSLRLQSVPWAPSIIFTTKKSDTLCSRQGCCLSDWTGPPKSHRRKSMVVKNIKHVNGCMIY